LPTDLCNPKPFSLSVSGTARSSGKSEPFT
jgi:hypothetical protein